MVDWSPIIVDVRRAIQKSSLEVRNGFAVPKTIPEDAVIRVRQITLRIIREITVRFQKLDRLPILSKKNSQAGSLRHLFPKRALSSKANDAHVVELCVAVHVPLDRLANCLADEFRRFRLTLFDFED